MSTQIHDKFLKSLIFTYTQIQGCYSRGWTLAPAGDEGHVNVWGSAAPDK
jgi:hypothetical protein